MSRKPAATMPATAGDPVAFQLLNEIGIISQLSQARAAKLLAPMLNLSQFVVLNHFERLGGERSLVQLAGALQVSKAAMTNTVARLLAKGLVEVRPDPDDGRGKLVSPSVAGRAARRQAVAQLGAGLADLAGVLPVAEVLQALPLLRSLRIWLDDHR